MGAAGLGGIQTMLQASRAVPGAARSSKVQIGSGICCHEVAVNTTLL